MRVWIIKKHVFTIFSSGDISLQLTFSHNLEWLKFLIKNITAPSTDTDKDEKPDKNETTLYYATSVVH